MINTLLNIIMMISLPLLDLILAQSVWSVLGG